MKIIEQPSCINVEMKNISFDLKVYSVITKSSPLTFIDNLVPQRSLTSPLYLEWLTQKWKDVIVYEKPRDASDFDKKNNKDNDFTCDINHISYKDTLDRKVSM